MKRFLLSTLTLSLLACAAGAGELSGIDTEYIDPAVRVQDDFYLHLNGKWMATTEIPADRPSWGTFAKLRDDVTPQIRALIEADQKDPGARHGSEAQKIGDLYASFMDEKSLEALGYKPLTGELHRIHAVQDKKALPVLIAHLAQIGVHTPYSVSVSQDARESTKYAAHIGQAGLGLPDRDYYLKTDDTKLDAVRAKYVQHIEKTLAMTGLRDAAQQAKAVVALETALAQIQWTKVENRDPVKRYNKVDIAKLGELAPGYDWKAALSAAGVAGRTDYVLVSQPSYLKGFVALVEQTELATWKAYFQWQLLRAYAEYLNKDFSAANFAFYGTAITGTTLQRPRWKLGVGVVENLLGEAVGKQYVAKYFPPERKARMDALVKNLLAAYKQSIDTLDWMSPATKLEAQAKLAKFHARIAYPDKWRDYAAYAVVKGDLVGNIMRAHQFAHSRNVGRLGKPIDRDEWNVTPQTVNANYNATKNEITFPAGILQPPFFDARADDAVNYGAIGAVIGHEISHGFDDKGSQSDGDGNLRDWWTKEDRANFQAKADALAAQYSSYSPLPGYHVNGKLTLGENIADNSGLAIAYKAYKISLAGKAAPVIDGLSGEQRFYMGFGQVWRTKMRDEQQIVQIKTDAHAPGRFRANGTVVNQPGFHEAFGVKEGDHMYVAPKERIVIW
ncbi:MAG: M13-type metalloendopeptidase [Pseudomonadota bacterium]